MRISDWSSDVCSSDLEEITGTYVVVAIWDQRRLIVPLQYFIEKPFQNWTRHSSQILGTAMLWTDYRLPVEPIRAEVSRLCKQDKAWDGRVGIVQRSEERRVGKACVCTCRSGWWPSR